MEYDNHIPIFKWSALALMDRDPDFVEQTDGVYHPDECIWTDHILNFHADHAEVCGVRGSLLQRSLRRIPKMCSF